MSRLNDKLVYITEATSRIGATCARRFVWEEAQVVGFDVSG